MKHFSKLLASLALLTVFVTFSSCNFAPKSIPFEGDWERPDEYVVSFEPSGGYFKSLTGGIWLDAKLNGNISVGEKCYRNITSTNNKNVWKCQIRIYNTYKPHETMRWEDCTLSLNSDGSVITVKPSDTGSFLLNKYE